MDLSNAKPLVLDTLTRACSQQQEILTPAEQQLKSWETEPGFYHILQTIFCEQSLDVNVRFLAVLYFKNGVDRYWRKNAPKAIMEEEKAAIRQQLIANFNEPVNQIAVQLAVLISKIGRHDVPKLWPELLPRLIEAVQCDDILLQQRALLTLYHVIKMLASKRLAHDRRVFEELTSNIFTFILNVWKTHTERVFSAIEKQDEAVMLSVDHSILTLKVLRRMVTFGFKDFEKSEQGMTFINMVFQNIEHFLKAKPKMQYMARDLLPKREKALTTLTKLLLDVQDNHPVAYIHFIPQTLEMSVRYTFSEEVKDLLYERFTVNMFNLIRAILRCDNYRPAKVKEDTKDSRTLEAHEMKCRFFSESTLREIAHRLILNYFLLTQDDLQLWDDDPEEFVSEEGGDSWKFTLRPCVENLYLTLMKEFRDTLAPIVIALLREYQGQVDCENIPAILQKDAVYTVIGLASFDLYDEVDFDQWLTSSLILELQNKHTNNRILRRRVVWLIGCWTGVKMSVMLRPTLYSALIPLLDVQEDFVVRIEAALTLKLAVDDFDFSTEQFLPYLESSFAALFQLLKDVHECETKMQVLHVMSFIIERMRIDVRPHASTLIQYLPLLWEESADHNMLRCAILTTLTYLVQALGAISVSMYEFLLPVVQMSTDSSQEPYVYLGEDGIELWQATLHAAPAITPQLLQIYHNMPALLELGTDTQTCLKIVQSYILLGPQEFLQMYGSNILESLTSLLTDLRQEGMVIVFKVVELVFKVFPDQGPQMFSSMLPGVLSAFINEHESPMVVALRLSLFCRLILQNQSYFWLFIDHMAQQAGTQSNALMGQFLDVWFEKMDNVIQPERKKLSALALAALITSKSPAVLERFGGLVNMIVEALHDVCRTDPDTGKEIEPNFSYLVTKNEDLPEDELETEHDKRKRQLNKMDPIHSMSLREYTLQQLEACRQQHGDQAFGQIMELVDCEITQQLDTFIKQGGSL